MKEVPESNYTPCNAAEVFGTAYGIAIFLSSILCTYLMIIYILC